MGQNRPASAQKPLLSDALEAAAYAAAGTAGLPIGAALYESAAYNLHGDVPGNAAAWTLAFGMATTVLALTHFYHRINT